VAGDQTENWRLILKAARALTAAGQSPFTRVSVYEWIWRRYPRSEHDWPSLDPVFQGMIRNAPGGPVSSAGTPLVRIGRGEYVLASATVPGGQGGRKGVPRGGGVPVTVAWGRQHGIDIRAVSGAEVMLLEAKGSAMNPPQQVNYFLAALGELLQRMSDPEATYGLALPDSQQYRGLAASLPALAWQRLRLTVLFVSKDDAGQYTVQRITMRHRSRPAAVSMLRHPPLRAQLIAPRPADMLGVSTSGMSCPDAS
jgi:hypothetical protein